MKFVSFCNNLSERDWTDYTQLPLDALVKQWACVENIPFQQAWLRAVGEMIRIG